MLYVIAKILDKDGKNTIGYKLIDSYSGVTHKMGTNKAFSELSKHKVINGLSLKDNKIVELGTYPELTESDNLRKEYKGPEGTIIGRCGNTLRVCTHTGLAYSNDILYAGVIEANKFTNGKIVEGSLELTFNPEDISDNEMGVDKVYKVKQGGNRLKQTNGQISFIDTKDTKPIKKQLTRLSQVSTANLTESFDVVSRDRYVNIKVKEKDNFIATDFLYTPGYKVISGLALVEIIRYSVIHYVMVDINFEGLVGTALIAELKDILYMSPNWHSFREDGDIEYNARNSLQSTDNTDNDIIIGIGELGVIIIQNKEAHIHRSMFKNVTCIPFELFNNKDRFKHILSTDKNGIKVADSIIDDIYNKIEEYRKISYFSIDYNFKLSKIPVSNALNGKEISSEIIDVYTLHKSPFNKTPTIERGYIPQNKRMAIIHKTQSERPTVYMNIYTDISHMAYKIRAKLGGLRIDQMDTRVIPLNTIGYIELNRLRPDLYGNMHIISNKFKSKLKRLIAYSVINGDVLSVYTFSYKIEYSISKLLKHADKMRRYALKMKLLTGHDIDITDDGAIIKWGNGDKFELHEEDEIYYILYHLTSRKADIELKVSKSGSDLVLIDKSMFSFETMFDMTGRDEYTKDYSYIPGTSISIKCQLDL